MTQRISSIGFMLRRDKRTLKARGRRISNVDFIRAMRTFDEFREMESTQLSNTIRIGIQTVKKAEKYARVFREYYGIPCTFLDVIGYKELEVTNDDNKVSG